MSTSIEIWNMAMSKLGADRITAFGADSEAQMEAALGETIYYTEKKALLRMFPWNCAIRRDKPAKLADKPVAQYDYAFQLPDDFIRLLDVRVGDEQLPSEREGVRGYEIEGRTILTNYDNINIRYIADIDEAYFDSHLVEVLVAKLVFESVFAIGQSATALSTFGQVYEGKLNEARTTDSLENPHVVTRTDSLIQPRYNGY